MEESCYYKLHVREVLPELFLRPYIRRYYFFENKEGINRFSFHALSNGFVEILLLLDNYRILLHQEHKKVQTASFISGIMELNQISKVEVDIPDVPFRGVGILLSPLGVNRLLGSNLKALTNRVLDLRDFWSVGARWFQHNVQNNGSEAIRIDNLNHYFLKQLEVYSVDSQKIIPVLQKLEQMTGYLQVGKVATELGVSYKWLYRRFVDDLGMTPKSYLRILRFDRACYMLDHYRGINETNIAHQCGYYDQAHFLHEFKKIMRISPGEYVRRQLGRFYFNRANVFQ